MFAAAESHTGEPWAAVGRGGFLAALVERNPAEFLAEVRRISMRENAEGLAVVSAGLGDDRLLIGAAELAFAAVLEDPR